MGDTIVALSSGPPPAAIGVIRLSGPQAIAAATAIAGSLPELRRAGLRALRHDGRLIDRALTLVFPGPDSATGEDLVEFHVHGGLAVVRAVENALLAQMGVVRAEPGAFTRRALFNGRLDLAQVEALGDLLAAQTDAQARTAILGTEGLLRRNIDALQGELLMAAADVELALDFADEDDGGAFDRDALQSRLHALENRMRSWLGRPCVEILNRGFRVVLAGRPNAGKSTLLNAMAGRDAAIVSPIAGTTRDRIEVSVAHGGIPFVLTDTAGLVSASDDPIEMIGVERARDAMAQADVLLWLEDSAPLPRADAIRVAAQLDRPDRATPPAGAISVSGLTGEGLERLWSIVHAQIAGRLPPEDGSALNERQHALLSRAMGAVVAARDEQELLLLAEQLRAARYALDQITGAAGTEAMLDQLFGRFCIGK
ncbi:tRNA uridine-5-carboxymethylaminomethyl(34) synthesis GTPase MnmE [uncultured Sphingomonas sp.]|uniref:tRNA uridine-5-carboxymethylaminomethyl(34) synthesis GTPase MnmE n=1 Tax=uncultured Sphingomonas sp. TaxID=158754 RepID=UPI0025E6375B|nr:tRNA uridine-5-carboxymethylaminomethyl(34) synthesis GTPase MnmE [uncultured Sphingomonas sp.]